MTMRACLLPLLLALGACNENMVQQPRYDSYETAPLFADGQAMQAPPAGTVDLRQVAREKTAENEPVFDRSLLLRGQERYGIFCGMCHGLDGRGNGVVATRGFPHPRSLLEADQRSLNDRQIFDAITDGYGIMYAHRDRIPAPDRWAIVGWVRVLQQAQRGDAR